MRTLALLSLTLTAIFAAITFWLVTGTPKQTADAQSIAAKPVPASPIQRCMNMGGALEAANEGDWGYTVRQQDFTRLKAAGFDTIRLPVKVSAHTAKTAPYAIDEALLTRVDEIIGWAIADDLQIILDVHHYEELNDQPRAHEPRLEAMWDQLATRYAAYPANLMFEFINEPYGAMTVARTDRLNARLLARIRQDNPDRWVVIGSAQWGSLMGLLDSSPPYDPRVITTFHYYEPFEFTHQGANWTEPPRPLGVTWGNKKDRRAIQDDMGRAAHWRDQTGMPMLLGEFGVFVDAPMDERARWTAHIRRSAEAEGIGWCYWEWGTGFPVYDLKREAWMAPIRAALLD